MAMTEKYQPNSMTSVCTMAGAPNVDRKYPVRTVAGAEGLEPTTLGFGDRCSTN